MAKSIIEAVNRSAAQSNAQAETRTSTVGRSVVGFRWSFTQEEWSRIEAERQAMRERLTAEG